MTQGIDEVATAVARWLAPYVADELAQRDSGRRAKPDPVSTARSTSADPAVAQRREWQGRVSLTGVPSQGQLVPLIVDALNALGGEAERQEIVRRAIEIGEFTDDQLAVTPPPSQIGRYPSKVHYHLAWAMNLAKNGGLIEKLGHARWRLAR